MGYIYALRCPDTGIVRYVGRTIQNPRRRLSAHMQSCKKYKHHAANWLSSLRDRGLRPVLQVLEATDNLAEREVYWLDFYKSESLTNTAPGGFGGSATGRIVTDQHRENLRQAALKQWGNSVLREATVAGMTAVANNPARRERIRNSKLGVPRTSEAILAMSRGRGIRPFTDQHGRTFDTVNGCARQLGIPAGEVSRVLRGKARSVHGLIFKFIEAPQ